MGSVEEVFAGACVSRETRVHSKSGNMQATRLRQCLGALAEKDPAGCDYIKRKNSCFDHPECHYNALYGCTNICNADFGTNVRSQLAYISLSLKSC
jgi:hypothetical protein